MIGTHVYNQSYKCANPSCTVDTKKYFMCVSTERGKFCPKCSLSMVKSGEIIFEKSSVNDDWKKDAERYKKEKVRESTVFKSQKMLV